MHRHEKDDGAYWKEVWRKNRIFWEHNGNPNMPHIVHPCKGLHSNGLFRSEIAMENPFLFSGVTTDLAKHLKDYLWKEKIFQSPIRVVGSGPRAIALAHDLARHLGSYSICRYIHTERLHHAMIFPRTISFDGEYVLLCAEELITGASIELSAFAARHAGGTVLPLIAVLLNQSGLTEIGGKKIFALIDHPIQMWKPDECPLCKEGSTAISPNGAGNWDRLYVD